MQDILINTECWLVSKENVDNFSKLFNKEKLSLRENSHCWFPREFRNDVWPTTAEIPYW